MHCDGFGITGHWSACRGGGCVGGCTFEWDQMDAGSADDAPGDAPAD